jgi:hypothetical protein
MFRLETCEVSAFVILLSPAYETFAKSTLGKSRILSRKGITLTEIQLVLHRARLTLMLTPTYAQHHLLKGHLPNHN